MVFHSDRGSQFTSRQFRQLLAGYGIHSSMGGVGTCYDNAVVERFFGRLKHDWTLKVHQPTRDFIKQDVAKYIKYCNLDRLHSANSSMTSANFENQVKVSCFG